MALYGAGIPDASVRALQRRLTARLPAATASDGGLTLEMRPAPAEAARCVAAQPLEGDRLSVREVSGERDSRFAAFLDGTQRTTVIAYLRGLPLVHGLVAAVVRVRSERRLSTWSPGPKVGRLLCAPLALLAADERVAIEQAGVELRDSGDELPADATSAHPFTLVERSAALVEYARERCEQALAEHWSDTERGSMLFVDGGISGSERIARSANVVGVVKSHRRLYAEGDDMRTVLGLRSGERSTVFRVAPARRAAVASWYLRLRDPTGHDPMWGLVRVEIAQPDEAGLASGVLTPRANEISRWVLAEAAPLALPDARWDKMVYGVRDCEEFLRAVV